MEVSCFLKHPILKPGNKKSYESSIQEDQDWPKWSATMPSSPNRDKDVQEKHPAQTFSNNLKCWECLLIKKIVNKENFYVKKLLMNLCS